MLMREFGKAAVIGCGVAAFMAAPVGAIDLMVSISGVPSDQGEVGCALYAAPRGFPLDTSAARVQWRAAKKAGVTCSFEGLDPGAYALAVSHDLNGNRRTDTNAIGFPTEAWGVSKGARPTFRPPTFSEAAFEVTAASPARLTVRIAK